MPEQSLPFVLMVFAGFFAIMNPIVNTPIFIGLTDGLDRAVQKRIAAKATFTAFLIVLVLAAAGRFIFDLFGLTLPAFRITGGILVFIVGFELLRGETPRMRKPVDEQPADDVAHLGLAISPLAIPILAGPGTIVTAASFMATGPFFHNVVTIGVFAVMCLWTYWMFVFGERMVKYLGKNAVSVIGRLMGLILTTLGVHMLTLGVYGSVVAGIDFVSQAR